MIPNQISRCSKALKEFQAKHPTITSADMQTFILAFQMGEESMLNETKSMLVACFIFSGANNNQGLYKIKGESYGEKANTVINAQLSNDDEQSIVSTVAKFT